MRAYSAKPLALLFMVRLMMYKTKWAEAFPIHYFPIVTIESLSNSDNNLHVTWSVHSDHIAGDIHGKYLSQHPENTRQGDAAASSMSNFLGWLVTYRRADMGDEVTEFAAPVLRAEKHLIVLRGISLRDPLHICVAAVVKRKHNDTKTDDELLVHVSESDQAAKEMSWTRSDDLHLPMISENSLRACSEWHPKSQRALVGILASIIFLTPCLAVLAFIVFKDWQTMKAERASNTKPSCDNLGVSTAKKEDKTTALPHGTSRPQHTTFECSQDQDGHNIHNKHEHPVSCKTQKMKHETTHLDKERFPELSTANKSERSYWCYTNPGLDVDLEDLQVSGDVNPRRQAQSQDGTEQIGKSADPPEGSSATRSNSDTERTYL